MTAASNGQEALDKVRKTSSLRQPRVGQPFDAVVMDIEMPGRSNPPFLEQGLALLSIAVMDGLTALRHIRAEEAAGDLGPSSVIALSASFATNNVEAGRPVLMFAAGNARQGQIDDCRAAGFDDVCLKPYRLVSSLSWPASRLC